MTLEEFGTEVIKETDNKALGEDECYPSTAKEDGFPELKMTQWTQIGPGSYMPCSQTVKKLKSGVYEAEVDSFGKRFVKAQSIKTDDLLKFKDSFSDKIIKEIEDFWNLGKEFREWGFLHRRGIMLYGPAGGGKTSVIQQLIKNIIDRDGIVLLCTTKPKVFQQVIHDIRGVEPKRPLVCVFEDIDAIIHKFGEDDILSLLDGETLTDRVLNIATTNYPERLDKRIVSRPRRFDRMIKVEMPNKEIRSMYFKQKLKIKDKELEEWVGNTEGFSFASMAELVISVKCLKNKFEDAVGILKKLTEGKHSSDEFSGKVGFNK